MRGWIGLAFAATLGGADFSQRGFLETRWLAFPQTAPNDRGRAVGAALLRYEASYQHGSAWRFSGGVDARIDTHHEVERRWGFSWQDRERRRPAFSLRRLSAQYGRGPLTLELGKQIIRWGKADILNPTDRFAPRDYLAVVDNEVLAVTAARLALGAHSNTLELVFAPRFTPSRIPLVNQRWAPLPPQMEIREAAPRLPGAPQYGARWNHVGAGLEYSLSFYEGYQHLPSFDLGWIFPPAILQAQRYYPKLRMYGGDVAAPLGWVTVKGEAAWLQSPRGEADEYLLYVVQLERQSGEWLLVGGYAGEKVTRRTVRLSFSPDRGLAQTLLGRATYTLDANRSLALEGAVRQNGKGLWLKVEYSQALGQYWRVVSAFTLIRGAREDFLGQYRRNSHASLTLRYSF